MKNIELMVNGSLQIRLNWKMINSLLWESAAISVMALNDSLRTSDSRSVCVQASLRSVIT